MELIKKMSSHVRLPVPTQNPSKVSHATHNESRSPYEGLHGTIYLHPHPQLPFKSSLLLFSPLLSQFPRPPLMLLGYARHAPVSLCTVCSLCLGMLFPQRVTRLADPSPSGLCSKGIFSLRLSDFLKIAAPLPLYHLPPLSCCCFSLHCAVSIL